MKYLKKIQQTSEYDQKRSKLTDTKNKFEDCPVVKTPCFHCKGHGFHPWSKKFHAPQSAVKKKKNILVLPERRGKEGAILG